MERQETLPLQNLSYPGGWPACWICKTKHENKHLRLRPHKLFAIHNQESSWYWYQIDSNNKKKRFGWNDTGILWIVVTMLMQNVWLADIGTFTAWFRSLKQCCFVTHIFMKRRQQIADLETEYNEYIWIWNRLLNFWN